VGVTPRVEESPKVGEAPPGRRPPGVGEGPVVLDTPGGGGTTLVEEEETFVVEDAATTKGRAGDEELPEVEAEAVEVISVVRIGGAGRVG